MLKLENVKINYDDIEIGSFDLNLDRDQIVTIIGTSGSGKTSLVKAICNVQKYSGKITLDDREINKKDYTYITQSGTLFNHLTVYENLNLTIDMDYYHNDDDSEIEKLLNSLSLDISFLNKYPFQLSGGEKQRIDLLRGIMSKSNFLVLDESFSALDSKLKDETYELIKDVQQKYKILVIVITHDLIEACFLGDCILAMDSGKIKYNGTISEFLNTENEFIKEFVSDSKMEMLRRYIND